MRSWVRNDRLEIVSARRDDLLKHRRRRTTRGLTLHYIEATDLRGLSEWQQLIDLEVELGRLKSLNGLESLPNLKQFGLGLGWNRKAPFEIGALRNAPPLEQLFIGITDPIVDLSPIGDIVTLKRLDMFYRDPETAARISEIPLENLMKLNELRWWSKADTPPRIMSLEPFARAKSLRRLDLFTTEVSASLAPLLQLPRLEEAEFSGEFGDELEELRRQRPNLRLRVERPFRPPAPDLVIGAIEVNYLEEVGVWDIFQDLSGPLGVRSNHEADRLVRKTVRRLDPDLYKRLEFDPEADYSSISTPKEEDIRKVAEIINDLVRPLSPDRLE